MQLTLVPDHANVDLYMKFLVPITMDSDTAIPGSQRCRRQSLQMGFVSPEE